MERDGNEDGDEDGGEDGEGDFWGVSVLVLVGLGLEDTLVAVGVGLLLLVLEAMRPLLDGALKTTMLSRRHQMLGVRTRTKTRKMLGWVPGLVPPPIMLSPLDLIELEDPDLSE